jgi:hypothetical protein
LDHTNVVSAFPQSGMHFGHEHKISYSKIRHLHATIIFAPCCVAIPAAVYRNLRVSIYFAHRSSQYLDAQQLSNSYFSKCAWLQVGGERYAVQMRV